MSFTATAPTGIDLRALANDFAPGTIQFDLFGFVSGYKAYLIYTALAAKSDADLANMGFDRTDLPAVAMASARQARES